MEEILKQYIEYMKEKHHVIACMVVGSYLTNEMGPQSDIDLFFVWNDENKSIRGREFFEGYEFEYFISPEWKYYDRLEKDLVSVRIYSSGKILFDSCGVLDKIKSSAMNKMREYKVNLTTQQRKDYKFFIDTILTDGEGLYDKKDYMNFLFFTGSNLQKMNEIMCLLHHHLPTYNKYGIKEITEFEPNYGKLLSEFLCTAYQEPKKKELWIKLCDYLQSKLGDDDIKTYESRQILHRP